MASLRAHPIGCVPGPRWLRPHDSQRRRAPCSLDSSQSPAHVAFSVPALPLSRFGSNSLYFLLPREVPSFLPSFLLNSQTQSKLFNSNRRKPPHNKPWKPDLNIYSHHKPPPSLSMLDLQLIGTLITLPKSLQVSAMKGQNLFPLGNISEGEENKSSIDESKQNKLLAAQRCPLGWVKVSREA